MGSSESTLIYPDREISHWLINKTLLRVLLCNEITTRVHAHTHACTQLINLKLVCFKRRVRLLRYEPLEGMAQLEVSNVLS
jgi:hypothetical protein